ncbi:MAG: hypothetical protein GXO74_07785 [Calditrichaeota bacterium]|nr:hypothetical protein [Calditrichota bacterium]
MNQPKKITFLQISFVAMGFTAMMTQIVLLREFLSLFVGNELTIGIVLAMWLLFNAIGAGALSPVASRSKSPINLFRWMLFALAWLILLVMLAISSVRNLLNIPMGEGLPPGLIFLTPAVLLPPICLLSGFLYALACKILADANSRIHEVPGRVYLLEGIGSGVAAFVASIFLFRYLENRDIALIISLINFAIVLLLNSFVLRDNNFVTLILILISALFASLFFPDLYSHAQLKKWGDLKVLDSRTTIYGNIAFTEFGGTVSYYENGVLIYSHPDELNDEEIVHFALLEHPQPKNILVISGNWAGLIPQILFHPSIQRVDFLLLDPESFQVSTKFLPATENLRRDPRVKIHFEDGRKFLRRTNQKYDVILINLPPPQTTMLNRYFTQEFYQLAAKKLSENGVLSFSVPVGDVIGNEQAQLMASLLKTLRTTFADVKFIPGYSTHFLASKTKNMLTTNSDSLSHRIAQRHLPTKYIRDYYIKFRLTPMRLNYLRSAIANAPRPVINRDLHPVVYFQSIYLWLSGFFSPIIGKAITVQKAITWLSILIIFFAIALFALSLIGKNSSAKSPAKLAKFTIFIVGSASISLEIIIINGFQAIYGYAYYQIALIMSGFMIGLAAGSWYALRKLRHTENSLTNQIVRYQFIFAIYPLLLYAVLQFLSSITFPEIAIQIIFFLLISSLGFITGHQFPFASAILSSNRSSAPERSGGSLYAFDLIGSVVGSIFITIILLPFWGVGWSCLLFVGLNLTAGLFWIFFNKEKYSF